MSTAAYRSSHSSRSFTRQHIRTSSTNAILPTMTNDRTKFHSQTNTIHPPVPPIRESLSTNSIISPKMSTSITPSPSLPAQSLSTHDSFKDNSVNKISKQRYTFSNPPREVQRQSIQNMKYLRPNRLRQRVSSAPDENSFQISPRSILHQQKPSSANESSTPRSHDDNHRQQLPPINNLLRRDEQQKSSLNALIKQQERSKVPKAVQKRRIILLFRRLPPSTSPLISPRQQQNSSPIKPDHTLNDIYKQDKKPNDDIPHLTNYTSKLIRFFVFKKSQLFLFIFKHLHHQIHLLMIHFMVLIKLN
jgi:hypothetical protein